jgi:hypothetical protein
MNKKIKTRSIVYSLRKILPVGDAISGLQKYFPETGAREKKAYNFHPFNG